MSADYTHTLARKNTRHNAVVIATEASGVAVKFRHANNPERIEWIAGAIYPVGTKGMVHYEITNRSGLWKFKVNDDAH